MNASNTVALFCCLLVLAGVVEAQETTIEVNADQTIRRVSRFLTGACIEDVNHEIYGGIFSQMIFGESFQEPAPHPELKGFTRFSAQWVNGI